MDEEKLFDSARRWRCFSLVLLLVLTVILSTMAAIILYYEIHVHRNSHNCATRLQTQVSIQQEEPHVPPIFHDLTTKEIKNLMRYVYNKRDFNVSKPNKANVSTCYLYVAELHVPSKSVVLNHLDLEGEKPPREAKIVLFRGDKSPPVVEEYVVGPLHNISYHHLHVSKNHQKSAPYLFRPTSNPEYKEVQRLLKHVDDVAKYVLEESYDASFFDCFEQCLTMSYFTPATPAVTAQDIRKVWYWTHHLTEYYILNPVDFYILFNLDGNDPSRYKIEKIMYAGQKFDTAEELVNAFTTGSIQKSSMPFPEKNKAFSKSHLRGTPFPSENLRSPKQIEPDGKRYSVIYNKVKYMNWEFDFRMSSTTGPQLFDIRFQERRIIYELSLQEIAAFYFGHSPWIRFGDFVLSGLLIGAHAKVLIPSVDCPSHATYLASIHLLENSPQPVVHQNTFCLFEHSTAVPLRRHYSNSEMYGRYFTGLEDIVLILRTIITIAQCDFVIDYIFHQNGAIEVKVTSSGYLLPTIYTPEESRYGFKIKEKLVSNIFQHNLHFKIDIDVHGTKNRFETLDIEPILADNTEWSVEENAVFEQIKFRRNLVMTELQSLYHRNFSSPKYFIFHNNQHKTHYNDPRGYEIRPDGGVTQLISEGNGNEPSVSWIRHQMAVSKLKDEEDRSSSIYSMWDAKEPIINFQSFLDDNESIIDEDVVAWITLGLYHIPHFEDLPLTTTIGKHRSFTIQPFNYFEEDPSIASRDAIRISVNELSQGKQELRLENYGLPKLFFCESESQTDFLRHFNNNSNVLRP